MGFIGALLAVAVALVASVARRLPRAVALSAAAGSIAVVALLAANVFGDDDYVDNGSSRWETRSGNAHALFIAEAALGLLVAAGLVFVAIRRRQRERLAPLLTFAGVLEAFGAWAVLVGFNAN